MSSTRAPSAPCAQGVRHGAGRAPHIKPRSVTLRCEAEGRASKGDGPGFNAARTAASVARVKRSAIRGSSHTHPRIPLRSMRATDLSSPGLSRWPRLGRHCVP